MPPTLPVALLEPVVGAKWEVFLPARAERLALLLRTKYELCLGLAREVQGNSSFSQGYFLSQERIAASADSRAAQPPTLARSPVDRSLPRSLSGWPFAAPE